MYKPSFLIAVAVAATFLWLSGTAGAAETADTDTNTDTKQDFGTQTCKEVMRLSGSDRDISLAFAHGYMLGKQGTTQFEVDVLAQITDRFIDYCLDHPSENALASFEKVYK